MTETNEAVVCAFANQKGGVGKSTLTHLIAKTITSKAIGKKCLVVELDKQKTLSDIRETIKERQHENFSMPYDLVVLGDLKEVKGLLEKEIENYDIIILDTPGTLDKNGLISTLAISDIVFIPLSASIVELNSTVDFIEIMYKVKDYRGKNGLPFDYYTILNRVKKSTKYFKQLMEELGEAKVNAFKAIVPDREAYTNQHMDNYNPVYSYEPKGKKDANFEAFIEEFLLVVKEMQVKISAEV